MCIKVVNGSALRRLGKLDIETRTGTPGGVRLMYPDARYCGRGERYGKVILRLDGKEHRVIDMAAPDTVDHRFFQYVGESIPGASGSKSGNSRKLDRASTVDSGQGPTEASLETEPDGPASAKIGKLRPRLDLTQTDPRDLLPGGCLQFEEAGGVVDERFLPPKTTGRPK